MNLLKTLASHIRKQGNFAGTDATAGFIAEHLQIPRDAVRCYDECIDDCGDEPDSYVMKACFTVKYSGAEHTVRVYYLDATEEIGAIDVY